MQLIHLILNQAHWTLLKGDFLLSLLVQSLSLIKFPNHQLFPQCLHLWIAKVQQCTQLLDLFLNANPQVYSMETVKLIQCPVIPPSSLPCNGARKKTTKPRTPLVPETLDKQPYFKDDGSSLICYSSSHIDSGAAAFPAILSQKALNNTVHSSQTVCSNSNSNTHIVHTSSIDTCLASICTPLTLSSPVPGFTLPTNTTTLNPNAVSFAPSQASLPADYLPAGNKVTKRKTKQTISSDPKDIQLEHAKYALKTAKLKITEQETQVRDLKFKNNLLEERLKTVENLEKQHIHDQYFPPPNRCKSSCQSCHVHNACCAQSLPNCQNSSSVSFTLSDRGKIDQMLSDLLEQKSLLNSLYNRLNDFISLADVPKPPLMSVPTTQFSQIGASQVQASQESVSLSRLDNSVTSIDSIILETSESSNLNSNRPTIQLT